MAVTAAFPRVVLTIAVLAAGLVAPAARAAPQSAAACGDRRAGHADINGDGYDDEVVGDPTATVGDGPGAGAVRVLYGGPGGVAGGGTQTLTAGSPGVATTAGPGPSPGDGFGWSVTTAHVDDDRCLDVVIGAPWHDVGGKTDTGAVYVIFGAAHGAGHGRAGTVLTADTWGSGQRNALFGFSLSAADASGADPSAVAVGAPYTDRGRLANAGAAYVRWFTRDGRPQRHRWFTENDPPTREGAIANGMFGWSVALGSLSGDPHRADLVVGAPRQPRRTGPRPGAVAILSDLSRRGPVRGRTLGPVELGVPRTGNVRIGYALAYMAHGDDHYLAVGVPGATVHGHKAAGAVPILRSDGSRYTRAKVVTEGMRGSKTVVEDFDQFGRSVALGAHGRDGVRLGAGAPYETSRVRHDGAAVIVPLTGRGTARDVYQSLADIPGEPGDGAHVGWSVRFAGAGGTGPLLVGVPDDGSHVTGAVISVPDGRAARLLAPRDGSGTSFLDAGAAL